MEGKATEAPYETLTFPNEKDTTKPETSTVNEKYNTRKKRACFAVVFLACPVANLVEGDVGGVPGEQAAEGVDHGRRRHGGRGVEVAEDLRALLRGPRRDAKREKDRQQQPRGEGGGGGEAERKRQRQRQRRERYAGIVREAPNGKNAKEEYIAY